MEDDYNTNTLPHLYISLWKVGRMYFLYFGVKGLNKFAKCSAKDSFNHRDFWGIFPFDGLYLLRQDCRRRLCILWRRSFLDQTLQFKWACDVVLWRIFLVLNVLQVCLEGDTSKSSIMSSLSRGKLASGDLIPWTVSQQVSYLRQLIDRFRKHNVTSNCHVTCLGMTGPLAPWRSHPINKARTVCPCLFSYW